jgi:hypothetical protein
VLDSSLLLGRRCSKLGKSCRREIGGAVLYAQGDVCLDTGGLFGFDVCECKWEDF